LIDDGPGSNGTGRIRLLPALLAGVLLAAALYFARSVLAAVAFALLAMALVWPIQRSLQARMSKYAALALTVLLSLLVLTLLISTVTWGFSQIGHWMLGNVDRFQEVYSETSAWLEGHGIFVTGLLVDRFDVIWVVGLVRAIATRLNSMVGFALLVFAFATMGLLEVDHFQKRMKKLEQEHPNWRLSETAERISAQFRRYMAIRTLASILTGFVTFCFALLVGLELALAWGIISFVLNYIPFLGPLVAVVLATLFAAAQFESWPMILLVLAGLSLIQFSIGNYLEPLFAGTALAVSPFMVLFAVFFWSFLWGIPGAFIGVPMTMAMLVMCEQSASTRWIATLLSHSEEKAHD
jgi:predicted PurR-regulated permease PerM